MCTLEYRLIMCYSGQVRCLPSDTLDRLVTLFLEIENQTYNIRKDLYISFRVCELK